MLEATDGARRCGPLGRGDRPRLPQRPVQLLLPARVRLPGAARLGLDRLRAGLAARPGRAGPPAAGRPGRGGQPRSRRSRRRRWSGSPPGDGERWLARVRASGARSPTPMLDALFTPFPPVRAGWACCVGCGSAVRCGWPAGWCCRSASSAPSCSPVRAAGAAGRLRAAHRPVARGGGLRRVRLAAGHARPAGRLAGAGRRRPADHRRAGRPAAGARRPDPVRGAGRPGADRPGPGDGGAHRRRRGRGGPGGPCWPTCRRRRSTSTWSARRSLPPRLVEDLAHFRWDGSTVKVDWALAAPVPWRNPAVAGAGTVHLGADLNGLTRYAGGAGPRRAARATRSCWSAR